MLTSRRITPVLISFASLSMFLLVATASAEASGPSTVSFRAVGGPPQYETVVPLTQVTTTTAHVARYEGSCSGTSAAGALQLGAAGEWEGSWSSKYSDYEVTSIKGKEFPFDESSPANYYWSFWLDNKESTVGICEAELSQGDQVLFFPACYGEKCPAAPNVLSIQATPTAEAGKPVTVTVLSYPAAGGEPAPLAGATVTGAGVSSSPTDEQGVTTMTFTGVGQLNLHAQGPAATPAVPAEAFICVHAGNDGNCGTQAPSNTTSTSTSITSTTTVTQNSPSVVTAKITGVKNSHIYSGHAAPRVLAGSVVVPAGASLRKVQISLERKYHGHCFDFNGSKQEFVRIQCGKTASFFSVGEKSTFSYLLPARLPRGHYTYEIEAVNTAGVITKLSPGTSRVVFSVK